MLNHQRVNKRPGLGSIVQQGRAVRIGDLIIISGTVASASNGLIIGLNDPKTQTRFILDQIEQEIRKLGGELRDVTRLRVAVSSIEHWEPVARVFSERFASIQPANSLTVARLSLPQLLVKIAADATVGSGGAAQKFIL